MVFWGGFSLHKYIYFAFDTHILLLTNFALWPWKALFDASRLWNHNNHHFMIQMHQVSATQSVAWYKAPKSYTRAPKCTRLILALIVVFLFFFFLSFFRVSLQLVSESRIKRVVLWLGEWTYNRSDVSADNSTNKLFQTYCKRIW